MCCDAVPRGALRGIIITARRYASAVHVVVVCLYVYVCASVTRRYCVKMAKHMITQKMRDSHVIARDSSFSRQRSTRNLHGVMPLGRQMQVG